MRYSIYNKDNEQSNKVKEQIVLEMNKYNYIFDDDKPDIVIFIGGDGTFLKAVQYFLKKMHKPAFIGVKTGALGYFCDYTPENIVQLVKDIVTSIPLEYEYHLLEGCLNYEKKSDYFYAVNEIRIENPFKTLVCKVLINDIELEEFHGNGMLVSSSLGSTAYNKSCGGALVDPCLNTLQLTEINAIRNNVYGSIMSPIIFNETTKITFEGDFSSILVGYDNIVVEKSDKLISMNVRSSDVTVTLLRFQNHNYVSKLRHAFIKE